MIYLNERYYDEKTKEFNELKLGQLTIEEFVQKITSLQGYVQYFMEEKVKIQRFISCCNQNYKYKLQYDNLKTFDEAIQREKLCYVKFKQRIESSKAWQARKEEKYEQQKKGFRPSPFRNKSRNFGVIISQITIN